MKMLNPTLLRILTAIAALATAAGEMSGYIDILPSRAGSIAAVIVAVLLGLKEIAVIVGDIADDGKRNNSFKLPLVLLPCLLLLPSCTVDPVGNRAFLGLNSEGWAIVLSNAGRGAMQGAVKEGLPAYASEREKAKLTASKNPVEVLP